MKKHLLMIALLFLFQDAFSQYKEFHIKVKLTTELTNFSNVPFKTRPKVSIGGGLVLERRFNKLLAGQVGVLFRNRGWQDKIELTNGDGESIGEETMKINYNYLSLPFSIIGNFNKFYCSVGPSVDFILNATSNKMAISTDNVNKINSSVYVGAGYKFVFSEMVYLNIEASYNRMLFSVYENNNGKLIAYNYGLGFSLGYKL